MRSLSNTLNSFLILMIGIFNMKHLILVILKEKQKKQKKKVIKSFGKVLNYSFENGIVNSYLEYNS